MSVFSKLKWSVVQKSVDSMECCAYATERAHMYSEERKRIEHLTHLRDIGNLVMQKLNKIGIVPAGAVYIARQEIEELKR